MTHTKSMTYHQSSPTRSAIVILGIFAADLAFRAKRLPRIGETLQAHGFTLGAGGKGSNQAVAAARAGGRVRLISCVGSDAFGELALKTWHDAGIDTRHVRHAAEGTTGAAFIFVSEASGDNAIIVDSGAASTLSPADIDAAQVSFEHAAVFVAQLEQPVEAVEAGLRMARRHGVTTVLNPAPAPAGGLPAAIYPLCDYVTPNESEAELLAGVAIHSIDDARRAADVLLEHGAGCVVMTLGARGALLHSAGRSVVVPALDAGLVRDTTGAGDAFNGALAVALTEGRELAEAVRFASAVAAISVTRDGTAPSMPSRTEADALLARA
jgi:ribokinase